MNPLRGTETTLFLVSLDLSPFVEKQRIPFGGLKLELVVGNFRQAEESRKTMNPLRGTETRS